jgi:FixJ family two-component response regulator
MHMRPRQSNKEFVVFLVDDDPDVLNALARVLQVEGYKVKAYSSPKSFLDEHDPSIPGALVLDLSMKEMNGLKVQEVLRRQGGIERLIIFLTARATVTTSVAAMKKGAIDFLVKPVAPLELLKSIRHARRRDAENRRAEAERCAIRSLVQTLSPREKEVLTHLIAGKQNKQIASALGITVKTVKVHRGRVTEKMGVRSVADLTRMTEKISLRGAQGTSSDRIRSVGGSMSGQRAISRPMSGPDA